MIGKVVLWSLTVLIVGMLLAFWAIFFSPRPPVTTDPATLAGDGSAIDYCGLPTLDGSGKLAADIPKGNTPGCSYAHFPLPILAECTEPLVAGADDIRGLWLGVEGTCRACGTHRTVRAPGGRHQQRPHSRLRPEQHPGREHQRHRGLRGFQNRGQALLPPNVGQHDLEPGVLDFHVFGWGPVVVRRYRDGEQLVFEYADGIVTRMERICTLPEEARVPRPR